MSVAKPFFEELKQEAQSARKMLERAPEDKFGWRPHPKSMTLGQLCGHLAGILEWMRMTLETEELVFDPEKHIPAAPADRRELLDLFDANLKKALQSLEGQSDESMRRVWRMKIGDRVVMEMPRAAVLRGMILNHLFHHRGQLSVYLRLLDVSLPQIYGPTADEPMP